MQFIAIFLHLHLFLLDFTHPIKKSVYFDVILTVNLLFFNDFIKLTHS